MVMLCFYSLENVLLKIPSSSICQDVDDVTKSKGVRGAPKSAKITGAKPKAKAARAKATPKPKASNSKATAKETKASSKAKAKAAPKAKEEKPAKPHSDTEYGKAKKEFFAESIP